MSKHERRLEDFGDLEDQDFEGLEKSPEEEIQSPTDLRRLIGIIYEGRAIPEIGKTEAGKIKWLKIYASDIGSDKKKELLLFIDDEMPDFHSAVQKLYQNGIEPEEIIVSK
ncbi:MAG: hypothetical protein HYT62_04705 [Candidatus Yanofskybacteria bacterium]|nr:hypothetical protein [Candidatus Yanofskybacteria bacterium]